MQALYPRPDEHAAVRTDLKAIFVSLELSRSTWVITSLAPGGGEKGSVRARASQYSSSWDEADPGSCGLHDGEHGRGPPEVEQSAAVGGNVLVEAGTRAEEVAQFIVSPAEPGR